MYVRDIGPHEILLPVKPAFIAFTLLGALLMNLLPWTSVALVLKPDFVALVLLYWCVVQPRKVGFTTAWLLGVIMDVADGSLFGQHALAYSVLAYAGLVLHRRVLSFPMKDQVLNVIPLLLLNDSIVLAIRKLGGADFPGLSYFVGSCIAGALWPLLAVLFKMPQRQGIDPDHV